uniref:Uncharacterized protein n=1 Tax=Eutreptiella gymnastica TaxID=73025 RepID=A0A7S4CBP8_9EUGL
MLYQETQTICAGQGQGKKHVGAVHCPFLHQSTLHNPKCLEQQGVQNAGEAHCIALWGTSRWSSPLRQRKNHEGNGATNKSLLCAAMPWMLSEPGLVEMFQCAVRMHRTEP